MREYDCLICVNIIVLYVAGARAGAAMALSAQTLADQALGGSVLDLCVETNGAVYR